MKVYYIVNARIPTEKAHGWQISTMCFELANLGHEIELVVPTRNSGDTSVFKYYSLEENFKINYLKTPDFLKYERILSNKAIYLLALFFLFRLMFFKVEKDAIVYTRNPEIAWLFSFRRRLTFFDAHTWPNSKTEVFKKMLKKVSGIVCNSAGTAKAFKDNGFENILVAPNAVDLEKFNIAESKSELRKKLNLPTDKKIIMYVGHLYEWKGINVVMQTAGELRENLDYLFVLVGGTDNDINKYNNIINEEGLKNILLAGHKPQAEMPIYMKTADILLLPNVPVTKESEKYTSPIKMFEYMASKRLIITSDLPSLREILNEDNSVLFKAGSTKDLAVEIDKVLKNPDDYQNLIEQAFRDVQGYTWEKRAKRIVDFINEK
jgi:glycosyltransferase involved in cell wall biosynthesis